MAALARQLAALAVGARRAELLAAPASEAGSAHTGACDGVAQGPVLALAPVAAMRAPVVAIAACKRGAGQGRRIPVDSPDGGWDQPSRLCITLPRTGGSKGVPVGAFTNSLHQLVINLYPPPLNNQTSSEASFLNASLSQGHSSPRLVHPVSQTLLLYWNSETISCLTFAKLYLVGSLFLSARPFLFQSASSLLCDSTPLLGAAPAQLPSLFFHVFLKHYFVSRLASHSL